MFFVKMILPQCYFEDIGTTWTWRWKRCIWGGWWWKRCTPTTAPFYPPLVLPCLFIVKGYKKKEVHIAQNLSFYFIFNWIQKIMIVRHLSHQTFITPDIHHTMCKKDIHQWWIITPDIHHTGHSSLQTLITPCVTRSSEMNKHRG